MKLGRKTEATEGAIVAEKRSPDRWAWLVVLLGVGALLGYFIAGLGTRFGAWDIATGIGIAPWTGVAAVVALILAVVDYIRSRRKARKVNWPFVLLGTLSAIFLLFILLGYAWSSLTSPKLHDIATDLADPPGFAVLTVRPDNFDDIPGADDGDFRGMNPRQRWAVVHQEEYPDIRSVRISEPVDKVIERAERLAEDRGWDVALAAPTNGRLEATDSVSIFGLKQDIVIRARPAAGGDGSVVDMRSVSRWGTGDLGTNAERIRDFLSDLTGTTTSSEAN